MAFVTKTWKNRIVQFPNRRTLTDTNSTSTVYTVARNEGEVTQEGDAFSAENMNNLEGRISDAFDNSEPVEISTYLYASSWSNGTYTISDNRIHVDSGKETTQVILPAKSIQLSQLKALQKAQIVDFSQSEGQVVLKALNTNGVPTIDIPIRIQFRGYY